MNLRKVIMGIISLLSIYMINVPIFRFLGTRPISLLHYDSFSGWVTIAALGKFYTNVIKFMFIGLALIEGIAIVSLFFRKGKTATLFQFIAGLYEFATAGILLASIIMMIKGYNDMLGFPLFEERAGYGIYFMLVLGLAQMLAPFIKKSDSKKDKDIFDMLSGM